MLWLEVRRAKIANPMLARMESIPSLDILDAFTSDLSHVK